MKFLFITILFLISHPSQSAHWQAQGGGAEFNLQFNDKKIEYQGRLIKRNFEKAPCNEVLFDAFNRELYSAIIIPKTFISTSNLKLKMDEKSYLVNPRSKLGVKLVMMDDKIKKMSIAVEKSCQKR
ncbi:MAG: hypothetical protein K2P81_09660 [Bacteriovoracaceae bacterium]|nr:hypothetical protein [Bacteriovoracaceae bacterium]